MRITPIGQARIAGSLIGSAVLVLVVAAPTLAASPTPDEMIAATTSVSCGNGFSAVRQVLPHGFNALTATEAELDANHLPPRPASASALATWTKFVTNPISDDASCSELHPLTTEQPGGPAAPIAASSGAIQPDAWQGERDSANWDGNVADDLDYTQVEADWTIPSDYGPGTRAYSSQWVGLGSGANNTSPLYQAGTEIDTSIVDRLWFEVYPLNTQQFIGVDVLPGDYLHVHVSLTSTGATFYFDNESSGWSKTYTWTGFRDNPDHAEWIDERTTICGAVCNYPLYEHQNTTFTVAKAYYSGAWYQLGSTDHYDNDMKTCAGAAIADNSGLSGNDTFTAQWQSFGQSDPAPCSS